MSCALLYGPGEFLSPLPSPPPRRAGFISGRHNDAGVTMTNQPHRVTCCIAGGGPAGIMLGFLLARAGVAVLVLEKHRDFLRDFRGDTIHPSTLQVMHE